MDYYAIGQRIRKFRKAHGMSQEELSEKVGISTTHMSHIETGNTKLSLPVLVELSKALGVKCDDLLCERETAGFEEGLESVLEELKKCTPSQLRVVEDMVKTLRISLEKYVGMP